MNQEQSIKQALLEDPDLEKLKAEVEGSRSEKESQDPDLPIGPKEPAVEKFDPKVLFDWWRVSDYALQPLTLEELQLLYEREGDIHLARFEWEDDPAFSLTHLILKGWLSQSANIAKDFTVRFRSVTIQDAEKISDALTEYARDQNPAEKQYRLRSAVLNLSHAWTELNGSSVSSLAAEQFNDEDLEGLTDADIRLKFIETRAQEFIDQVCVAYGEFQRRSMKMVRGTLQGN